MSQRKTGARLTVLFLWRKRNQPKIDKPFKKEQARDSLAK